MIEFATVLGFLGLLGLIVLILIYILKPNYQHKVVSSSYVWKLSLKYKKKRIPINKLRNILILICQIFIVALCAFVLAKPFFPESEQVMHTEQILILDASASMLATNHNGISRFERGVEQARLEGQKTINDKQGKITVILADLEPAFVVIHAATVAELNTALDKLVGPNELACSFGIADIDGAMSLAELLLIENYTAEVRLYTATDYVSIGDVIVVDVSERDKDGNKTEWNAAILDVTAVLEGMVDENGTIVGENFYIFNIQVGCFGKGGLDLPVNCTVYGLNGKPEDKLEKELFARFSSEEVVTVYLYESITEYDYVRVWIDVGDSFGIDNEFILYGGKKDTITVEYVSSFPPDYYLPEFRNLPGHNMFIKSPLLSLKNILRNRWNIELKYSTIQEYVPGGADFYIFEHTMPEMLPIGVIIIIDPNTVPEGLSITLGNEVVSSDIWGIDQFEFISNGEHPLLSGVKPSNILVSRYREIVDCDSDFVEVLSGPGGPALLTKNNAQDKITIIPFSVHMFNPLLPDWPVLMMNIFNFYMPATVTAPIFDVYDTITLNARGAKLTLTDPDDISKDISDFPTDTMVAIPGTYTLKQELLTDDSRILTERIYVKIAMTESNFTKIVSELKGPSRPGAPPKDIKYLLVYFALALVVFLLLDRLLHALETRDM